MSSRFLFYHVVVCVFRVIFLECRLIRLFLAEFPYRNRFSLFHIILYSLHYYCHLKATKDRLHLVFVEYISQPEPQKRRSFHLCRKINFLETVCIDYKQRVSYIGGRITVNLWLDFVPVKFQVQ